jgi:hypothetical protein
LAFVVSGRGSLVFDLFVTSLKCEFGYKVSRECGRATSRALDRNVKMLHEKAVFLVAVAA